MLCVANVLYTAFKDAWELRSGGFGFGCFVFLLGFFVSLGLAIYYSTLINGCVGLGLVSYCRVHLTLYSICIYVYVYICSSVNEKRTLKSPFEPEPVYSDASSHHGNAAAASATIASGGVDHGSVGGKADV
jgi:hypothetical protein